MFILDQLNTLLSIQIACQTLFMKNRLIILQRNQGEAKMQTSNLMYVICFHLCNSPRQNLEAASFCAARNT